MIATSLPLRLRALVCAVLLLGGSLGLAACGAGGYAGGYPGGYDGGGAGGGPDPVLFLGTVEAANDTATAPSTLMYDFALWPSGTAASSVNLLPYALLPGEAVDVADVDEDAYDADAYMSDGIIEYLETWSSVYVVGGDVTTFFAF